MPLIKQFSLGWKDEIVGCTGRISDFSNQKKYCFFNREIIIQDALIQFFLLQFQINLKFFFFFFHDIKDSIERQIQLQIARLSGR